MVSAVRRLLPYLLRYRRRFALGLSCVLVTTGVSLVSPWVLKHAVDDLYTGVTRGKLVFYAMTLLGIAAVGATFRFLMRRILIGVSRNIEYDLRNDFFARLQLLPASVLPGAPHGRPDVARHQRPQRRPDDGRPGDHVFGEYRHPVRRRHRADAVDRLRS